MASCCCQHNAYQRAQVSWTTSSVSEPRQPAWPSRTASMSRVMAGQAEDVLTRAPAAEIPIPLCPRARRAAFPGPVTPGGPPSDDTLRSRTAARQPSTRGTQRPGPNPGQVLTVRDDLGQWGLVGGSPAG